MLFVIFVFRKTSAFETTFVSFVIFVVRKTSAFETTFVLFV